MVETRDIPDALRGTFQRLIRRMPVELRKDQKLLESIIVYLKLGGERLTRQRIEVAVEKYREEVKLMKRRLREEAMIKAATMPEADPDGDENDEDENSEDDEEYGSDDYNESPGFYD